MVGPEFPDDLKSTVIKEEGSSSEGSVSLAVGVNVGAGKVARSRAVDKEKGAFLKKEEESNTSAAHSGMAGADLRGADRVRGVPIPTKDERAHLWWRIFRETQGMRAPLPSAQRASPQTRQTAGWSESVRDERSVWSSVYALGRATRVALLGDGVIGAERGVLGACRCCTSRS